jgi:phosphopantetheinyl transferase (holo-ACP synthase)
VTQLSGIEVMLAVRPDYTKPDAGRALVSTREADDGVVARAVEVVAIEEAEALLAAGGGSVFSQAELAFARARVDPARRLAARLAAKRAAVGLLGEGALEREVEVVRGDQGPPRLRLSGRARERLAALGASRALVSLTHERRHAAALVLLLRGRAWRRRAVLAARLTVLLLVGVAAAGYFAYAPVGDSAAHPFNHDRNGVWLEHRWLERRHPESEMEALFTKLRQRGIGYAYPHVIPFDASGQLPPHDREQLRAFLAAARRVAPELKLLPWIGGLRKGYKRQRPGTIELADLTQRQRMVAEARGLVDEGFDGVHLNVEPVDDDNVEFLALLRALRTAVGADRVLSLAAVRPAPLGLPRAPNFAWSPDYYARVAATTDQIVIMAYDTALPTPSLYRRYVRWATRSVAGALDASGSDARVLMGIPTYEPFGFMHRRGVETPENALVGVVAGLRGLGAGGTFEGVALYAEWTTDESEWRAYERYWRNRPE